jgi:hypothetical protein
MRIALVMHEDDVAMENKRMIFRISQPFCGQTRREQGNPEQLRRKFMEAIDLTERLMSDKGETNDASRVKR